MRPEAAHGFASGDCRGTSYGTAAITIVTNACTFRRGIPFRTAEGLVAANVIGGPGAYRKRIRFRAIRSPQPSASRAAESWRSASSTLRLTRATSTTLPPAEDRAAWRTKAERVIPAASAAAAS